MITLEDMECQLNYEMGDYKSGKSKLDFVESIDMFLDKQAYYRWKVTFNGPPNTPYEGGKFLSDITYDMLYPRHAPKKVELITQTYHINISNKKNRFCSQT